VVELCTPAGTTCLVNDRVDVALAVGAAGTHLGAGDLPLAAARRIAGPGHLLGGTAREPALARRLVAEGADYLGVGPAYPTQTKTGLPDALGPAGIRAVAEAVDVPVIAIGGITAARVAELLAAGATGVAVVGAVSGAADPGAATRELLRALDTRPLDARA
jgi:thiamine-phosphate pyrophosphorylase